LKLENSNNILPI